MQCDFWMRLNVKSISYMHDSIQHNKTMHAKIVFQDFDSFKGEGDHSDLDRFSASKASGSGKLTNSDHPGHSETLTTPTTRKNWSGTMNCVEKNCLKQQFSKTKVVCEDNLQSLKKKSSSLFARNSQEGQILQFAKRVSWRMIYKIAKFSRNKNFQMIDPERSF